MYTQPHKNTHSFWDAIWRPYIHTHTHTTHVHQFLAKNPPKRRRMADGEEEKDGVVKGEGGEGVQAEEGHENGMEGGEEEGGGEGEGGEEE